MGTDRIGAQHCVHIHHCRSVNVLPAFTACCRLCWTAGQRRVWHSGSISTYKAHVWLYPDAGVGIFAALAGPQRYDTTDVLYGLMQAISDIVVFNMRQPAVPDYSPVTPRPHRETQGEVPRPPRPLIDYTGKYVEQRLRMNATVTLDEKTGDLRLTLGRMLTAELRHYDCPNDEFDAFISGRLWWVAQGFPERALLSVRFRSSVNGSLQPDVLELPLEMDFDSTPVRWSRFTRPGVWLVDNWTSLDHNSETCSTASYLGPRLWLFVLVICHILTL